MKKRILVLSYYFSPDISACSFRTSSLIKSLKRIFPELEVDVVATVPSRYSSYKPSDMFELEQPGVRIFRIPVPDINIGLKGEIVSWLYYARGALSIVRDNDYDLIYATSSKLATAALARKISKEKTGLLYIDVRDLFSINVKELFHPIVSSALGIFISLVEKYSFTRASKINVVSDGFTEHISQYIDLNNISHFTNGVDEGFLTIDGMRSSEGRIRVVYAGNIGRAQSLEKIIPRLANRLKDKVDFTIIGDGRKSARLNALLSKGRIKNVVVHPPVPRLELNEFYRKADVLFLHLDDCDCLSTVIPSKIFEYAATGLPILCGAKGFTKGFIEENVTNAAVFSPNDVEGCITKLESLVLGVEPRIDFMTKFSRAKIMDNMVNDIGRVLYDE